MSDSVKKVSINRIIGNVIGNLGLKNTNNLKDDFARWACEAESKIGSTNSYKRFECEIVIRNRKAALPPNFAYLNAVKLGTRIIPITKRSFRLFEKGVSNKLPQPTKFNNNQKILSSPGVPLVIAVIFTGSYAIGDLITITVTSNRCGNINSNTFNYLVQAGDTLTSIAANISTMINAINGLGYTASGGNDQLFITGDSPELSFTVSLFTDSATGFLSQTTTQQRVPPTKGTDSGKNCEVNLVTGSSNLANDGIVRLNTGLTAQGSVGGSINPYSYDYNVTESAFTIDNGCLHFNALDDTRVGISYMGIDLDDEGWPLIAESHEDAVSHYIMYMYKSIEFYSGKLPNYVHQELKTRWFDLCGQARGDDELPNLEEMKYLSNMWMQLIPPPTKEIF